jgi:hypothetical protein
MLDSSAANLNNAITYARDFLASISKWSVDIGKPVILEEVRASVLMAKSVFMRLFSSVSETYILLR